MLLLANSYFSAFQFIFVPVQSLLPHAKSTNLTNILILSIYVPIGNFSASNLSKKFLLCVFSRELLFSCYPKGLLTTSMSYKMQKHALPHRRESSNFISVQVFTFSAKIWFRWILGHLCFARHVLSFMEQLTNWQQRVLGCHIASYWYFFWMLTPWKKCPDFAISMNLNTWWRKMLPQIIEIVRIYIL